MDRTDTEILNMLQQDSEIQLAEIAKRVNLSQTPCWRRIQRLEEAGYILRRVALLNPGKLNVSVTVFVTIKTNQHDPEWFEKLRTVIHETPEVVGFYRLAGTIDYLLRVVVPDIAGYDEFYKKFTGSVKITEMVSSFVIEEIKETTSLPLKYIEYKGDCHKKIH